MSHPFERFTHRHPAIVDRILGIAHLGVMLVPAATILAAMTGHTRLAVVGVFVSIGFYAIGYAAAASRYIRRIQQEVAEARRDPLTGLPNRAVADAMLADATRSSTPMTVALIDVDGLNMVNANFGHAAGDQYLLAVAQRLTRAVPDGGVLVRQGGDEFTLLAGGVDPQQLATDIGAALAGPTVIAGYRIQPRASVGIAVAGPSGTANANHARARADSAMYTAKLQGGNKVRVFDPDRDPEPTLDGTRPLVRRRDINPLAETAIAWLPAHGDGLIPVLLSPDDVRRVTQALTAANERWAQAVAEACAGAKRPEAADDGEPDQISVEPTRAGYTRIACLASEQHANYTRLIERLRPIVEASETPGRDSYGPTTTAVTRLELHDTEPEFGVQRCPDGDVELRLRAGGVEVCVDVGDRHEDVSLLAESLRNLVKDVTDDILDGWPEDPDEFDGYISFDRGRWHVLLDGTRFGDYPSREVAEIELARAMVTSDVFPNAWLITDHGNHVAIDDDVRRWHDQAGTQMAPIPGVQYRPGDRVWYAEVGWPHRVVGDWGPAGVEIHAEGDHTMWTHVTDRDVLRPDTD